MTDESDKNIIKLNRQNFSLKSCPIETNTEDPTHDTMDLTQEEPINKVISVSQNSHDTHLNQDEPLDKVKSLSQDSITDTQCMIDNTKKESCKKIKSPSYNITSPRINHVRSVISSKLKGIRLNVNTPVKSSFVRNGARVLENMNNDLIKENNDLKNENTQLIRDIKYMKGLYDDFKKDQEDYKKMFMEEISNLKTELISEKKEKEHLKSKIEEIKKDVLEEMNKNVSSSMDEVTKIKNSLKFIRQTLKNEGHSFTDNTNTANNSKLYSPSSPTFDNGFVYSLPTHNRYGAFNDMTNIEKTIGKYDVGDKDKIQLIGDTNCSAINNLNGCENTFGEEIRKKSKRVFSGGALIDTYTKSFENIVKKSAEDASIVLHCGTEDFHKNKTISINKLLDKFRTIIHTFKSNRKSRSMSIAGILPRLNYIKGQNIGAFNRKLESLCVTEGVQFIQTWKHFYKRRELYVKNGVHLSDEGKTLLGKILTGGAVHSFLQNHLVLEKTN